VELGAFFLGLGHVVAAIDPKLARHVVDGEQTPPLLHGHGLVAGDAKAALLDLRVEAVQVQMHDHARTLGHGRW
jgi:hypothetical protein